VQISTRSELGHVRKRNEDSALVQELVGGRYLVGVADGMGGHPAGDVASRVAVEAIAARVDQFDEPEQWLVESLRAAHDAVRAAAAEEPTYTGMGTTAVLAVVSPEQAWVAHVGDSRAYLVRGGQAAQLTDDHNRHGYLLQAIGSGGGVVPDSTDLSLQASDRLLLCTDGLSGLVDQAGIGELASTGSVHAAADALVDAALRAGGYDNVTVVVVEV
jgi:protein phosphatase